MKIRFLFLALVLIIVICGLESGILHFLVRTETLSEYISSKWIYRELFLLGDVMLVVIIALLFFYRAFTRQQKTLNALSMAHKKLKLREDQLRKINAELTASHAALFDSSNRFQKMTNNIPGAISQFSLSPDGTKAFPFFSEKCFDLLGITAEAIQRDPEVVFGFIHPDDRAACYATIDESARTLKTWHWEGRFLVCGTMKWLKGVAQPERQPDGSILWDGLMMDVTDIKRAEQALQQSNQMLQLVLDTIPSAVFWKDRDLVYLGCNRVVLEDAGVTAMDAIVRKTDLDLVWREKAPGYQADDRMVMETNMPKLGYEEPFIKADHSLYWLRTSKVPMRDTEGKVIGVLGTYEDITERKKIELALQESEERFQQVANCVHEWIWEVNVDGLYTYSNAVVETILGYKPEDIVGKKHFYDFFTPEVKEQIKQTAFEGFVKKEAFRRVINPNVHKNGKIVIMETSGVPMLDKKGNLLGYRGLDADITERNQAEDKIRKSLQEKEVLLKEIHHRVKNNLQVVSSLLNIQSKYVADPRDIHLFKESQMRMRTMALIHEKLYQSIDLAQTHFAEYLRLLIRELQRSYQLHDVQIHVDVEDHIRLSIDMAIPCALIIHELVSNALKYAFAFPAGATDDVEIRRHEHDEIRVVFHDNPNDGFLLAVSDNGVGFPEAIDFRNTSSLGLQLVITFVKQLGGTISLDDVKPGTIFTIRFAGDNQN